MVTTGGEIFVATKVFGALINDLYVGAKDSVKSKIRKWASGQYSEKIAERIASVENVRTFWQLDREVPIRDFYFPMSASNYEAARKIISNKGELDPLLLKQLEAPRVISSLAELGNNRCVIEGTVGQGKSIFMRFLCVQELSQGQCKRIPIFIEMRTITPRLGIAERVIDELLNFGIEADDEIFEYLCESGKLSLLLDGYDELPPDPTAGVFHELSSLSRRFPDLQIVVSSRPDTEAQKLPGFPVMTLASLGPSEYVPFLQKLGLERVRAVEIAQAINESPTKIASLISTPLTLTLTVLVYNFELKIPPELDEFYEALFTTVITRHDKTKPGFARELQTKLGERGLRKLFEAFCFMTAQRELTRTLSAEQFATAFERAIKYSDEAVCTLEDFRSDICKVACLMQEEGIADVTYLHKSIAEYFAASFVRRQQENAAVRFYGLALQDDAIWKGVLFFLSKIDQYRYNALYLIPLIDRTFGIMEIDLYQPTNDSIEKFIIKIANSVDFFRSVYKRNRETLLPQTLLGNQFNNTSIIEMVFYPVLDAVSDGLPADLSLVDGYASPHLARNSESEIPGRLAFDFVGIPRLVMPFKVAMARIQSMHSSAKSFTKKEESKQDIF